MTPISPDTMVSALAAELPGAAEVFRARGINFCCGGNRPLSEAALKAGLPTERLVADLQALADAAAVEAPEATPALIDHIVTRYHQTHRDELDWLIPLAQRVERVHGDHEDAPLGLTEALIALQDDLEAQMAREESGLFALMRQGETPMIGEKIAQTRREHQGHGAAAGRHRARDAWPFAARGRLRVVVGALHRVAQVLRGSGGAPAPRKHGAVRAVRSRASLRN